MGFLHLTLTENLWKRSKLRDLNQFASEKSATNAVVLVAGN